MKNVTLVKQSYQNDTLLPRKCNKQQNQFGSSDIKSYQLNNMKQSKNEGSTYLLNQKKIICSICGKDITTGNSVGNKDGDYCVPCWYQKEEKERQEKEAELIHKQWARWQTYLFNQSAWTKDGCLIPKKLCKKLQKLIDTPYSKLSKKQKERYLKEIKNL